MNNNHFMVDLVEAEFCRRDKLSARERHLLYLRDAIVLIAGLLVVALYGLHEKQVRANNEIEASLDKSEEGLLEIRLTLDQIEHDLNLLEGVE